MNVINRTAMVLLLAAAILSLVVFIMVPLRLSNELAADFALLGEVLEEYEISLFSFSVSWILFVLLGGMALVVLILILYLEVRRPRRGVVRILRVSGGEALVSIQSVAQRLEHSILQVGDILEVRPTILPRRAAVDVRVRVTTAPEVDIPAKTEEICQVAREVLEEQMGLSLRNIQVRLSSGPYTYAPPAPPTPAPISAATEEGEG